MSDDVDPRVRAAAFALARPPSVLPEWMQLHALGRDMTPIAEICLAAADAVDPLRQFTLKDGD